MGEEENYFLELNSIRVFSTFQNWPVSQVNSQTDCTDLKNKFHASPSNFFKIASTICSDGLCPLQIIQLELELELPFSECLVFKILNYRPFKNKWTGWIVSSGK